jgi:hypothetical protein
MRSFAFALSLLALLIAPVGAAGKEPNAPVRVLWNSTPGELQAAGAWDARLSVLRGPGGFDTGNARPEIVVTDLASGAKRRLPMTVDVPPNTFKATVAFPRAGSYAVTATAFDPRHPARSAPLSAPVAVGPPPTAAQTGAETWPWLVAAGIALAFLVCWGVYSHPNRPNARGRTA